MTSAVEYEKPRRAARKLADFRNGLEPRERVLIDAVVYGAFGSPSEATGQSSSELPSEEEAEALVAKLKAFEETLSPEEQQVVGAVLAKGARPNDEVEAHSTLLWHAYGDYSWFPAEFAECVADGGGLGYRSAPIWYWPSRFEFWCWGS
jgi:hypothetical protein